MPPSPTWRGCPASGQDVLREGGPRLTAGSAEGRGDREEGSPRGSPRASSCIVPPASPWTGAPRQGCSENLRVKAKDVRAEAGPAVCTVRSPPAPVLTLSWGPGPVDPQPGGVSAGQQTPELHPYARPPQPGHSWAAARAQVKVSQGRRFSLLFVRITWHLASQFPARDGACAPCIETVAP